LQGWISIIVAAIAAAAALIGYFVNSAINRRSELFVIAPMLLQR
jgi:CDP-diglyceride synthetase